MFAARSCRDVSISCAISVICSVIHFSTDKLRKIFLKFVIMFQFLLKSGKNNWHYTESGVPFCTHLKYNLLWTNLWRKMKDAFYAQYTFSLSLPISVIIRQRGVNVPFPDLLHLFKHPLTDCEIKWNIIHFFRIQSLLLHGKKYSLLQTTLTTEPKVQHY